MVKFILTLCIAFLYRQTIATEELTIAVASNFTQAMKPLVTKFEQISQQKITVVYGSTGTLANQIKNGAPYDILLAADESIPHQLLISGYAVSGSQFTYALGKLVLWSRESQQVDQHGNILKSAKFKHLAIANPKLAPYGASAYIVLKNMELLTQLTPKIVQANNISSTYEYIASGNAELGFIALSQITQNGLINAPGSMWIIPNELYPEIKQDAILLIRAKNSLIAQQFLTFLRSNDATTIIKSFGYSYVNNK